MPDLYSKDSYLFEEGENISEVWYLLEGTLGLIYRFNYSNNPHEILFSQIKNNTFFGLESYFDSGFSSYSVKSLDESNINQTPIKNREELEKIIKEKPNYGIQMLRSLLKMSAQSANIITIEKLFSNLAKLEAIGKASIGYLGAKYNVSVIDDLYMENVKEIFQSFENQKIDIYPLSKNVFQVSFNDIIDEELTFLSDQDKKEITFFSKLYSMPGEVQSQFYGKEPFFIAYYVEKASLHFASILKLIRFSFDKTVKKYSDILNPQNLIRNLLDVKKQISKNQDLVKYITTIINTILSNTLTLSNSIKPFAPVFIAEIEKNIITLKNTNAEKMESQEETGVSVEESYTVPEELKNSTEKILKYADLDEEAYKKFIEDYNKFKLMSEKLSGDDSIKRFRNNITNQYWHIYEKCMVNFYRSGEMNKPVEMMLRYGFFDEDLIHPKTIVTLYEHKNTPIDPELPIYDTFEWLQTIMTRSNEPSINAMGETYLKYLKEESTRRSRKELITPEEIDKDETRIEFEIKNLVKECSKICSGEIFNYSPILMNEAFAGDASKYFAGKNKMKEMFFQIKSLDFGAFYREYLFRHPEASYEEIITKEILPNVILLPSWGKRPMVWQVKERSKDTRGRINLPIFVLEDLKEMIIEVFGIFRWELLKELLGPSWADITQLSLTSEYMDYVQFYKKNKDLSSETKEKIGIEFKKYRSDREKFVNDYTKWIKMESEGRPSLNKVVRNIFYRQIPFPRDIRNKICKMPAYEEIHTKFTNMRRKDIIRYQNKYAKYIKDGKQMPDELQASLDFYKL